MSFPSDRSFRFTSPQRKSDSPSEPKVSGHKKKGLDGQHELEDVEGEDGLVELPFG